MDLAAIQNSINNLDWHYQIYVIFHSNPLWNYRFEQELKVEMQIAIESDCPIIAWLFINVKWQLLREECVFTADLPNCCCRGTLTIHFPTDWHSGIPTFRQHVLEKAWKQSPFRKQSSLLQKMLWCRPDLCIIHARGM